MIPALLKKPAIKIQGLFLMFFVGALVVTHILDFDLRTFAVATLFTAFVHGTFGLAALLALLRWTKLRDLDRFQTLGFLLVLPLGGFVNAVLADLSWTLGIQGFYWLTLGLSFLGAIWNLRGTRVLADAQSSLKLLAPLAVLLALLLFHYHSRRGWMDIEGDRSRFRFYNDQFSMIAGLNQIQLGMSPDVLQSRMANFDVKTSDYYGRFNQYAPFLKIFHVDIMTLSIAFNKVWSELLIGLSLLSLGYTFRRRCLDAFMVMAMFFFIYPVLPYRMALVTYFFGDYAEGLILYLQRAVSAQFAMIYVALMFIFWRLSYMSRSIAGYWLTGLIAGFMVNFRAPYFLVVYPTFCASIGWQGFRAALKKDKAEFSFWAKSLSVPLAFGITLVLIRMLHKDSAAASYIGIKWAMYALDVVRQFRPASPVASYFFGIFDLYPPFWRPIFHLNYFFLSYYCGWAILFYYLLKWTLRSSPLAALEVSPLDRSWIKWAYFFVLMICLLIIHPGKANFTSWQIAGSTPTLITFAAVVMTGLFLSETIQRLLPKMAIPVRIAACILLLPLLGYQTWKVHTDGRLDSVSGFSVDTVRLLRRASEELPNDAVIVSNFFSPTDAIAALSGRRAYLGRSYEMLTYYPEEGSRRMDTVDLILGPKLSIKKRIQLAQKEKVTHLLIPCERAEDPGVKGLQGLETMREGCAAIYVIPD